MIILSAFFSASETAFSSVNLIRLRQYADEGRPGAKKALNVAERFDEVLLAILIGNNVVNLASASIATIVATDLLGASGAAVATGVMTILIIILVRFYLNLMLRKMLNDSHWRLVRLTIL